MITQYTLGIFFLFLVILIGTDLLFHGTTTLHPLRLALNIVCAIIAVIIVTILLGTR